MQTSTHVASPEKRKADSTRSGKGIRHRWISVSDKWRATSCGPEQETPTASGISGTAEGGADGLWAVEQGLIARKHRELGHM